MKPEEVDKLFAIWGRNVPKCPGCGKVHERKRVGESFTYEVKHPCNYIGFVPLRCFGETLVDKKPKVAESEEKEKHE